MDVVEICTTYDKFNVRVFTLIRKDLPQTGAK